MRNLEKYKEDLFNLIDLGDKLYLSMYYNCNSEIFEKQFKNKPKKEFDEFTNSLISFSKHYQEWYSESLILIQQLLPDRLEDFKNYYEKPKNRKTITLRNYVVADYLQGLVIKSGFGDVIVDRTAAISQFEQQLNILKSVKRRFESTLFDIKQLTQADIFDSELDSAKELIKKGFLRGAGAISGVLLEKHLAQVCLNHKVKIIKKNPTLSDFNDKLKKTEVYETQIWRKVQHLGDLRNLCDHNKSKEPKKEDVEELIEGVNRIIKTIF